MLVSQEVINRFLLDDCMMALYWLIFIMYLLCAKHCMGALRIYMGTHTEREIGYELWGHCPQET